MASFTTTAGQKRSRGDYDEVDEWDNPAVEDIRKRAKHDTPSINSIFAAANQTSRPLPLPLFTTTHTTDAINTINTRPPLLRAQPLAFRKPMTYSTTPPITSTSSNPSPVLSTPYDRSPTSVPSPGSIDSPPLLMDSLPNDGDDVEMSDDNFNLPSETSTELAEEDRLQPRIRIRHSSSPPTLNFNNRPPRLNSQKLYNYHPLSPTGNPALSSSRIPTPIHPFFPGNPSPRTHPSSLISPAPPSSNSSIFSANRPMPSPIREDVDLAGSHFSKLSVSGQLASPTSGGYGGEVMSLDSPLSPSGSMSGGLLSPPLEFDEYGLPIRRGRARSGAITSPVVPNKRIFTGYLPTCDKCRARIPGHYMHFL